MTEEQRLAALRRYNILDTRPERPYDRLTSFAAGLMQTPIAYIAFVDAERIWFKSCFGIDLREVERTPGLCASCILQEAPWLIPDARIDARLSGNPLIVREGIQFYCGTPLRTHDGFNIGCLAILDRVPRSLSDTAVRQLVALSRILMDELELQHSARLAHSSLAAELARSELREDHIRALLRELAHRAKNLLAVVQALAWRTTESSTSVSQYAQQLTDRIQGLAHTHDLIAEQEWRGIAVEELVRRQTRPLGSGTRLKVVGPRVVLSSAAAQHIGLALNELMTNAVKYGAFASPSGSATISWQVLPGSRELRVLWQEEMEMSVEPPSRRGFGVMVLERIAPDALDGSAELSFAPNGLRYCLTLPLASAADGGFHPSAHN